MAVATVSARPNALVFTAPQIGTYRITSAGLVDASRTRGQETRAAFPMVRRRRLGDDGGFRALARAPPRRCRREVVTVYLNELTQTGAGTGTVNVRLLP